MANVCEAWGPTFSLINFLMIWRGRFAIENGAPTRPSIVQPEHGESGPCQTVCTVCGRSIVFSM